MGSKEIEENLSKTKSSKIRFFTPEVRIVFICLRKTFTKAPILNHFDPQRHIRIEIDGFGFLLREIFSQLTLKHMTYTNADPFTSNIN